MIPLLLIRHGPTQWNVEGRIQGHTDLCLSEAGRAQVALWSLPEEFRQYDWAVSPLRRAMETARLLGVDHARPDPRLMEMSWGQWEGYTRSELRARHAADLGENERRGLDFCPPGGESARGVRARLEDWITDVRARGRPVGAVTHKGVITAALALATDWDLISKRPYRLDWSSAHLFGLHADGTLTIQRLNIVLAQS